MLGGFANLILSVVVSAVVTSCVSVDPVNLKPSDVRSLSFMKELESVSNSQTSRGNKVEFLANGNSYFPRMLSDVRSAKHSIELETFIMMKGRITSKFTDILCSKAKSGVKVCILLDKIGSRRLDDQTIIRLRESGVKLKFFRGWTSNPLGLNRRTHRKYLIVDNRVVYTGGAGFADAWNGNGTSLWSWRENQYRIEGPAAAVAKADFSRNWGERLIAAGVAQRAGDTNVQIVDGNPSSGKNTVVRSLVLSLNAAEDSVDIAMAYVCPPKIVKDAIVRAHNRGVKLRVLTSGTVIDSSVTRRCAHHFWKKLVALGVDVYEYQPAMLHVKQVIIDKHLTIAGAANMDFRSYFINDENTIHIYGDKVASKQLIQFEKDLLLSKKLKAKEVLPFSWNAWMMQSQL